MFTINATFIVNRNLVLATEGELNEEKGRGEGSKKLGGRGRESWEHGEGLYHIVG